MSQTDPLNDSVEVRRSDIHGDGVFATAALPAGTYVGRYAGRRYTARQAARRKWNNALTYAFGLSDGSTIDGGEGGNATRHLNHSCKPNCEAREIYDDAGALHVDIYTLRRIKAGEELSIDYGLDTDGEPAEYPCRCGAPRCRGTMVAAERVA